MLITSEDYFSRTLYRPKISEKEENSDRITCTVYEEEETKKEEKKKEGNFFSDLKILSCHSLYIISMFCRVILHGLNTCMHFW